MSPMTAGMYSSATGDDARRSRGKPSSGAKRLQDVLQGPSDIKWETPPEFFRKLDDEFHFQLDACATAYNRKCELFFSPSDNGLSQDWGRVAQRVFMNPPYGRDIRKWVQKAWEASTHGCLVVCLLPARTDTGWWHDFCMKGEIRFVRGRLKFGGGSGSAPFPSAVVIFRPKAVP